MDEVEAKLEAEFPGVEILIHIDPEGQVDHPGNPLVETDLTKPGPRTTGSAEWSFGSPRSTPSPTGRSPAIPPR